MSEDVAVDAGGEGGAAEAVATSSFLDSVDEKYRSNPNLTKHTDINSLAQSHIHLNSMIGADKIARPQENWSDDQYNQFYTDIGRPASATEYQIAGPDPDDAAWNQYKEAAHAAGLSQRQAQSMADFLNQASEYGAQERQGAIEQLKQQTVDDLTREWGQAASQRVAMANNAAARYDFADMLEDIVLEDGRQLGDVPEIIKMFAQIAQDIGEDTLVGETKELVMTPDEAKRKYSELMATPAYTEKFHPEHDWTVKEVEKLFQQAFSG